MYYFQKPVKNFQKLVLVIALVAVFGPACLATVDDAFSAALAGRAQYIKEGFTLREDYWGGDLPVKTQKAIVQQLFKGTDYWFWMGTDTDNAKISVHVYDSDGNLAEAESVQQKHFAAVHVMPKTTGTYYLIVEIEKSNQERTHWALAYGYR